MKTVSVSIENLCVPCHCSCRHCLLSSQHRATGIEYARSRKFADKFYNWLSSNRPELGGLFYVGYCNEFPELTEHVSFVQKYAPDYQFLQFNGLTFRNSQEIRELLHSIMERNIRLIDLTFYGTWEYHDHFSGRKGDFDYLLRILKEANALGLPVVISIALTEENANQMDTLFKILSQYKISKCSVFLPHAKGRGASLMSQRITKETFDRLPQIVKDNFSRIPHKTEQEWLSLELLPTAHTRALTLSLTPENIDRLEVMEPADIIRELESLDDAYYAAIPSIAELAKQVGRPDNHQLFRFRDLALEWQKRYIRGNSIKLYDMNDERHSFSVRMYNER